MKEWRPVTEGVEDSYGKSGEQSWMEWRTVMEGVGDSHGWSGGQS